MSILVIVEAPVDVTMWDTAAWVPVSTVYKYTILVLVSLFGFKSFQSQLPTSPPPMMPSLFLMITNIWLVSISVQLLCTRKHLSWQHLYHLIR